MRLVAGPLAVLVSMTGVLTVPAPAAPAVTDPRPAPTGVVLHRVAGTSVRAAEPRLETGSTRTTTSGFSLVAVTWTGTASPHVEVRTRSAGHWSRWQTLDPMADEGDPTAPAARPAVHGTEPLWVGSADGVRTRVDADGARDLRLVLIDPGPGTSGPVTATRHRSVARPERAPRPSLHSRRAWGAKERWRSSRPKYNRTIQQVHIHHTATGNKYRRRDVPGLLRAIYRYHTHDLGWSDIGYNFLVDRFGRAWVGRAGGAARPVRGAHTLGFNGTSVGVSVIGNFEKQTPSDAVVRMLVKLAAWKLDLYDRDPRGEAIVYSRGSDQYPAGQRVRLPVIDGHRDTNDTACPGAKLYDLLPDIRERTGQRVDSFGAEPSRSATGNAMDPHS